MHYFSLAGFLLWVIGTLYMESGDICMCFRFPNWKHLDGNFITGLWATQRQTSGVFCTSISLAAQLELICSSCLFINLVSYQYD